MAQPQHDLLDDYVLTEIGFEPDITIPELEGRIASRTRDAVERLHRDGKVKRSGLGNNGDLYRFRRQGVLRRI